MTAIERVRSTRRFLGVGAIVHAFAWSAAVTLAILALLSFVSLAVPSIESNSAWHVRVALPAGLATFVFLIWRARHISSIGNVALWIEERIPALQYSLVTAIEDERGPFSSGIESAVSREDVGSVTRGALLKTVGPALGAAAFAGLLLYVSPSPAFGGARLFPRLSGALGGSSANAASRLENLRVRVTPPAYSGDRATTLDDPASVTGLVGSRIIVTGSGEPDGVSATAGPTVLGVADSGGGWSASLTMPAKPAALTFRDRNFERIIVLEPRPDNPPRVVLTSPERDSTLRVPRLVLRMNASATDDVGLNGGYFEYLVTTGSGEIFSARTITTPVARFGGSRRGSLTATLDLGSLGLNQGDVVSIRAIAQDVNTLSGPGLATSDTRTYRIARADEYDSVSIEAAGPTPVDSSAMSQRMLIMMTEQLVKEQKGLTRQQLVKRSTEIGDLEDRIRKRVHEILFEQEGGQHEEGGVVPPPSPEETPDLHVHSDEAVQVMNSDLLEAYNALWEAVRSLQIAEPAPALPPMRVALKALDRARLANRLYLRGLPPKVIVDLARVRMTGKEKGSGSIRTPLTPADSARAQLERRFNAAIELTQSKPADAIRAFTLLQVEAIEDYPSFASAVGEAVEAFRKGRDATLPLLRARRLLSGDPSAAPGLPSWSGGW